MASAQLAQVRGALVGGAHVGQERLVLEPRQAREALLGRAPQPGQRRGHVAEHAEGHRQVVIGVVRVRLGLGGPQGLLGDGAGRLLVAGERVGQGQHGQQPGLLRLTLERTLQCGGGVVEIAQVQVRVRGQPPRHRLLVLGIEAQHRRQQREGVARAVLLQRDAHLQHAHEAVVLVVGQAPLDGRVQQVRQPEVGGHRGPQPERAHVAGIDTQRQRQLAQRRLGGEVEGLVPQQLGAGHAQIGQGRVQALGGLQVALGEIEQAHLGGLGRVRAGGGLGQHRVGARVVRIERHGLRGQLECDLGVGGAEAHQLLAGAPREHLGPRVRQVGLAQAGRGPVLALAPDGGQCCEHLLGALEAPRGLALHGALDGLHQHRRGARVLERHGRALQDGAGDVDEVVAGVRGLAGEQLVQHGAQRVDVGAAVDVLVGELLGRHVARRPGQAHGGR